MLASGTCREGGLVNIHTVEERVGRQENRVIDNPKTWLLVEFMSMISLFTGY